MMRSLSRSFHTPKVWLQKKAARNLNGPERGENPCIPYPPYTPCIHKFALLEKGMAVNSPLEDAEG
jgi:hypothetical protein